jgi:hypothetical protein
LLPTFGFLVFSGFILANISFAYKTLLWLNPYRFGKRSIIGPLLADFQGDSTTWVAVTQSLKERFRFSLTY